MFWRKPLRVSDDKHTISNLDLGRCITLRNILYTSYDFRHCCVVIKTSMKAAVLGSAIVNWWLRSGVVRTLRKEGIWSEWIWPKKRSKFTSWKPQWCIWVEIRFEQRWWGWKEWWGESGDGLEGLALVVMMMVVEVLAVGWFSDDLLGHSST